MAKWIRLTGLDGVTPILVNLSIVAWIVPREKGSRVAFAGGADVYTDVRETPEQILSAPQVGW
jgi:hypothetical protein